MAYNNRLWNYQKGRHRLRKWWSSAVNEVGHSVHTVINNLQWVHIRNICGGKKRKKLRA